MAYTMFVYASGMVLISRQMDPRTQWNAIPGLKAVQLVARVIELQDRVTWAWYGSLQSADRQALELLRSKLGEEAYSKAWKEGHSITLEQAMALAREVIDE